MKSTEIIREVDGLGRIVIPITLRRALKIMGGDKLEFFVEGEKVVLRKYSKEKSFGITEEINEKTELTS